MKFAYIYYFYHKCLKLQDPGGTDNSLYEHNVIHFLFFIFYFFTSSANSKRNHSFCSQRAASLASSFSACCFKKANIPSPLFSLLVAGCELVHGRASSQRPDQTWRMRLQQQSGPEHEATRVGGRMDRLSPSASCMASNHDQGAAVASPLSVPVPVGDSSTLTKENKMSLKRQQWENAQ